MINTKLKIGIIILLLTIIVLVGLFISSKQRAREMDMQYQEITVQPENTSCPEWTRRRADYLGLSCSEFNVLSTSVREYLYQKYAFLRETDFGIRYERAKVKIRGVPSKAMIINATANFRIPPVVITIAFYKGKIYFVSINVLKGMS